MKKAAIIDAITAQLQRNMDELNTSLDNYETTSDLDENDTRDMEDLSQQDESKDIQRQLQRQLLQAKEAYAQLQELAGETVSSAKLGALVRTDKNLFFIGPSMASIQIGDQELICISPESPAFQVMRSKRAGDTFDLANDTYKIVSVE